jgi:predicted amidophosphoribosyltransferase
MTCPRCQRENREGRRFCSECGASLAVACAACGFSNEPGEKFCGGCGQPLLSAPQEHKNSKAGVRRCAAG